MTRLSSLFYASALLFFTAGLEAATTWVPNRLQSLDVMAETGVLAPLPTPIPFTNFRYPHIDDKGVITFIADDPVKFEDKQEPKAHGIYRIQPDGQMKALVVAGQTRIRNENLYPTYISGLQGDGKRFAFHAQVSDGRQVLGIIEGDNIEFVLDTKNTPATPSGAHFEYINYPDIQGNRIIFTGEETDGSKGLYLLDLAASPPRPKKLVASSTPLPGQAGRFFTYFGAQPWIDENKALFLADFVPAPKSYMPQPDDSGKDGTRGIYSYDLSRPSQPLVLLDGGNPVPFDPDHFFTFISSAIPRNGLLAVYGGWSGLNGIYIQNGKELKTVVDTQTEVSTLFEGSFTGFNKWIVNCSPWVLFRAYAADNYEAVFAYRSDEDKLYFLCDNRQILEGKKIDSFELSRNPLHNGNVALMVRFKDKESALYIAHFEKALRFQRPAKTASP